MFNFSIENFRSFQQNEFKFSKINILIGENSSGKSSLMKLLLALKQTLQHPISRDINLAFTGEYANLGSYRDAVYYHNENLPISFSFEFDKSYYPFYLTFLDIVHDLEPSDLDNYERLYKSINASLIRPTKVTYTLTSELDKHGTIKTKISNSSVGIVLINNDENISNSEKKLILGRRCTVEYFDVELKTWFSFKDVEFQKEGFMTLVVSSSILPLIENALSKEELIKSELGEKIKEFSITAGIIFQRIAFLLIAQNYVNLHLDNTEYINPISTNPSRVYLYKDEKQSKSIKDIEDVVNYFSKSNDDSKKELEEFVSILKKCGIAEGIEVISDSRLPVRELRVKVKDLVSNIMDVGYGVSLQLPILLKAWVSEKINKKNSFLLIEQPEVHLHPKLHAQLIDTLISLSNQTSYLIETHSEHIIRKLQVLVKEGKLKPEDVTIYYLKREDKKSVISNHKINVDGLLEPIFPSGFFDNSYRLSKELLD